MPPLRWPATRITRTDLKCAYAHVKRTAGLRPFVMNASSKAPPSKRAGKSGAHGHWRTGDQQARAASGSTTTFYAVVLARLRHALDHKRRGRQHPSAYTLLEITEYLLAHRVRARARMLALRQRRWLQTSTTTSASSSTAPLQAIATTTLAPAATSPTAGAIAPPREAPQASGVAST